jgi:hypothetical protein
MKNKLVGYEIDWDAVFKDPVGKGRAGDLGGQKLLGRLRESGLRQQGIKASGDAPVGAAVGRPPPNIGVPPRPGTSGVNFYI